jgi:hypothetical protein
LKWRREIAKTLNKEVYKEIKRAFHSPVFYGRHVRVKMENNSAVVYIGGKPRGFIENDGININMYNKYRESVVSFHILGKFWREETPYAAALRFIERVILRDDIENAVFTERGIRRI